MQIRFWNMGRKDSSSHLAAILAAILADAPSEVVLLCEYQGDSAQPLASVNAVNAEYRENKLLNSHLRILTTLPEISMKYVGDFNRASYWTIDTDQTSFTLCGVHTPRPRPLPLRGRGNPRPTLSSTHPLNPKRCVDE